MSGARHVVAGHFGELLQGRLGPGGPLALVTLPCPVLTLSLTRRADGFAPPGIWPRRADEAALRARLFAALGTRPAGRWVMRSALPRGGGAGGSTAALVAMAWAAGVRDPARIANACLAAEGAVDPLMLPRPARVLWASREGRALALLPPLPGMEIVGGFLGPGRRTRADDLDFPDIADLAKAWPAACARVEDAAALASESARRTLALRGPAGDPTEGLARDLGAAGFAIAHTGSARALIFVPGRVPARAAAALREAGFARILRFRPEAG